VGDAVTRDPDATRAEDILGPDELAEHRWSRAAERVSRMRSGPCDPDSQRRAVVAEMTARWGAAYVAAHPLEEEPEEEPCDHEETVDDEGRRVCLACGRRWPTRGEG
jgi:hypothetical protein